MKQLHCCSVAAQNIKMDNSVTHRVVIRGVAKIFLKGDINFWKCPPTWFADEVNLWVLDQLNPLNLTLFQWFYRINAAYLKTFFSSLEHLEPSGWVSHYKLHRFPFIDRHKCTYLTVNKSGKCIILRVGTVKKIWLSALQYKVGLLCFTLF